MDWLERNERAEAANERAEAAWAQEQDEEYDDAKRRRVYYPTLVCRELADAVLALGADEDGAAWAAFERRVNAENAVVGVRYTDSDPQLPGHPLYLAALLDLPRAAERLLALGASAAAPFAGESPLEAAAKRGSRRALAVLLRHVAALEKDQRDLDDEVAGERSGELWRAERERRRLRAEDDGAGVEAPDDDGAGSDAAADADAGGDGRPPLRRVWTHTLAAGREEVRLHRVPSDDSPELSSDDSRGPQREYFRI